MNKQSFVQFDPGTRQLICQGEWNLANLTLIQKKLKTITWPQQGNIIIDGQGLTKIDTAGALLFGKLAKKLSAHGIKAIFQNFSEQQIKLLTIIKEKTPDLKEIPKVKSLNWVTRIGFITVQQIREARDYLAFIGHLYFESLRVIVNPKHLRVPAIMNVIDKTGFQALPIIALLSFMIGVVIAYQMGLQLKNYGANIFIVDLLGLSVFREFGPILAAIMVAGRTGSAFTAQLGTMKVNQEIDALNTMGVTPAELLLLPRMLGLVIAMPLLTIWADMFGVFGGMLMAKNMLDISWPDFFLRFQQQIPVRALLIGIGKAPVFALIIASIGCFEGMQVKGSAESVGKQTTRSVVWGIFFIIVADAIFSIIFSKLKL